MSFFWGAAAALPPAPALQPTISSYSEYSNNSVVSSHPVTLPSGIVAGNLLLMAIRPASGRSVNTPSGWTRKTGVSSGGETEILAKVATGSEGATQTVTFSSTGRAVAITWRITDWGGSIATDIAAAIAAGNDCPALNPGWGTAKKLWMCGKTGNRSDWSLYETPFVEDILANFFFTSNTASSSSAYARMAAESLEDTFAQFFSTPFESNTVINPHCWTLAIR